MFVAWQHGQHDKPADESTYHSHSQNSPPAMFFQIFTHRHLPRPSGRFIGGFASIGSGKGLQKAVRLLNPFFIFFSI